MAKVYNNNPYLKAEEQAIQTGKFLGHFLGINKVLFPNCTVSLVGFSLGTQVILEENKL